MSAPLTSKIGTFNLGHGTYQGEMELVEGVYPNPHGYGVEKAHFREFKGKYEHGEMQLGVMDHKDTESKISGTFGSGTNHAVIVFKDHVYKGQTQNYRPHGYGVMEYNNGYNDKYAGSFVDGREHGMGIYSGKDVCYKGLWENGKVSVKPNSPLKFWDLLPFSKSSRIQPTDVIMFPVNAHGNVIVKFSKGYYEGEAKCGFPDGEGKLVYNTGDSFIGIFSQGVPVSGKAIWKNYGEYEGLFIQKGIGFTYIINVESVTKK